MKTAVLDGDELYYWVNKADGQEEYASLLADAMRPSRSEVRVYYQSIVRREHIDIASEGEAYCAAVYRFPRNGQWSCHVGRSRDALVAAMRAYVHSCFGAEVVQASCIPSDKADCCHVGLEESHSLYGNEAS